ncbi:hypothetical protein AAFM79_23460 [Trichormus azollae HNT15244]
MVVGAISVIARVHNRIKDALGITANFPGRGNRPERPAIISARYLVELLQQT